MTIRGALFALASAGLIACTSTAPTPPPEDSVQLRFIEAGMCPSAAVPMPLTFRIDPLAEEDVVAVAANGERYQVWWSDGFSGGPISDPVVRDAAGQIVAVNGEMLTEYVLHGHLACPTGDSIMVLDAGPS